MTMDGSERKGAKGIDVSRSGERVSFELSGRWTIDEKRPLPEDVFGKDELPPGGVRVDCERVDAWDSRLLVFLLEGRSRCRREERPFEAVNLPAGLERLLEEAPDETTPVEEERDRRGVRERVTDFLSRVGEEAVENMAFTGETVTGFFRAARNPRHFRWGDAFEAMQQTGAKALPIVGLISFLVGMILAYQGAVQLRRFGADIFVADLVGLAIVREMGPMMAAVVLAGRTGAAFAAQIGAMKVNEEVDALETLGLSPVDFLVLPRMLALVLMMPLLAVYADFLGIIGGLVVGMLAMEMTPVSYLSRTMEAILMMDVYSGLIKSVAFGVLIAYSGCLRGMQCMRSSAGVGRAATSAVVTGILMVIVADAIFAVIFNLIGL